MNAINKSNNFVTSTQLITFPLTGSDSSWHNTTM